ncbi:MAG: InlB B-repeat-containing protein, partial [Clostridia bacterium]|nr:InlB B-repeat-containing protein [Clostridia bacterium]
TDYAEIDKGIYTTVHTINVSDLYSGNGEIPEGGLTVYARAWVDETEEPDVYNNDSFISFTGLLERNNGEKLTTDTALEVNNGVYTVYADIRNNSMSEVDAGIPVAVLLDSNGNIIAKKNIQDTELVMGKESRYSNISVSFTSAEINGTPVKAEIRRIVKVSFDANGGTGDFADVTTDLNGHISLPESQPTSPVNNPPVFFRGWYTAPIGGELITEETFFDIKATVYAQYTAHKHIFEYTISDSGDTVIAKCVSTVNDDCPLEGQNRTATLTINAPERTATGYGMPNATISGTKDVLGIPKVYYYTANEAGTAKVGEALPNVPLNAGKYWAEFTLVDGDNSITVHVAYEIPAIEGLTFSEVSIPEYIRITDSSVLDGVVVGNGVEALAWIYANEDSLRPEWDEPPKYIVYGKRYMTRPADMPDWVEWPYEDGVEYASCYRFSYDDCNSETISVDELKNLLSNEIVEVYIEGTGSIDLQTVAEFRNVNSREELSNAMNPSTELDALLWILANSEKYSDGIVMLSQRDEYTCTFILFTPGTAQIEDDRFDNVFDISQWENMPIFVATPGDVINPNTSYTVSYDINGGNGNVSGGRYYVKSKIEMPGGDGLSKPNLVFDGWNTKANGTGDAYKPGDKFEVLGDTTLYAQWKHVHNWTVTYNEDTHVYTATCDVPGCPNSTITLHPEPIDKMYDGKNAAPYTNSDFWNEENGLPVPTVTFYQNGEKVSEGKNVGTYTAIVSLDGHENSVDEFHVTPRPIIVTADDKEKHEGEEDPELSVSYKPVGAELRFENDETYPWKIVTEGERIYAQSGNSEKGDTTSTLTLNVTMSEAGTISFDYKYGSERSWDWCRFHVDGNEKFSKSGEGDSWESYSCELSAGTHTITWSYSKDGGSDYFEDCFSVDNIAIKTGGAVTQDSTGDTQLKALNVFEGGVVDGDTLNYTIKREEGDGMGTYVITVTMGENPNYDVKEVRNGTFIILESLGEPQTIDASDVTATYGDTGVKINASITTGDGSLSYEVKSGDAVTVDSEGNLTIVKAGTAVITVVASQTETYARATKNVTVTVNPKAMTVSANNVTATVDGHPHGITVTVTDPAQGYTVKYGTAEGTYNLTASPTLTEAGTTTVYYQVTADNYETFTGSVTLTLVNHIHQMTYSVGTGENANTITATCSNDDCPLPNKTATLTISAPNGNIIYDGAEHAAVITDENGIQGNAKVLYYVKGADGTYGSASENAPVNAGTYKASITLGTGDSAVTVSVEFMINNASLTNVSVEQNGTLTYNGNAQTPQVTTAATAVNNQAVTFTYSLTENGEYGAMPTFTDVASAGKVYFKASAPNHDDATGSFTVAMNKADRTAPAAPTLDTATANTIKLTVVEGCEYSMDGTTWQDSATFSGLAKSTQYTFYQRLKENDNYNTSPLSASATIPTTDHNHEWGNFTGSGATITATCVNTDNGHSGETIATMIIVAPTLTVYGGTGSAEATVTNNIDGIDTPTVVYKRGDTVLDAAPTDAGTYTASITLGTGDDAVTASVTYTIAKKAASITAADKSKTYGADDPTLTAIVEGIVGNDTLSYTLSRAEGENVGEYTITVTLGDNPNYEVTVTNAKLTIGKKSASVTADNKSKTYGADDPTLTATVEGLVGEDTINYTLSRAEGNNVGEYAITVNLGDNPNYEVTVTNAKLTIGKKAATVTAADKSKTYGADDPTLTATVEGLVGEDTINYTLSRAEGNNVGEYTITVNLGDNPNYDVTVTNAKLTIGKKAATVTAADKSKTYGADDPTLTATVEGLVGEDT